MRKYSLVILGLVLSVSSEARPVSYPGGWVSMVQYRPDVYQAHAHYSPTARYSWGYMGIQSTHTQTSFHGVQFHYLAKRWNRPNSQANVYAMTAAGVQSTSRARYDGATIHGVSMDWENRRYFTRYTARVHTHDGEAQHTGRVGIAPYIGDYGDLHTWLMLQVEVMGQDTAIVPLIRWFRSMHLVELGVHPNGGLLFNWMMVL